MLGAIALTILPEMLRGINAQMRMIGYGVLLILALTFLPEGLISLIGKSPSEMKAMFKERITVITDKKVKKQKLTRQYCMIAMPFPTMQTGLQGYNGRSYRCCI